VYLMEGRRRHRCHRRHRHRQRVNEMSRVR
jgi:hypothetical protein